MAKAPAPVKPKKALAKAARPTLQQSAQTEIDPIIAAITGAANAKAKAADAAISGYTQSYANQLGQINAGAPYGDAEAKQAAVDAALESSLQGGGADLASQLSARLSALNGSSGEGAVQQTGGALASQGASAGGATTALGSAALGQLIGEHAAADTFSKKLPGLAKLSGLQGIKQVQGNAQQDINQGTLSAESQLPSIEQQIRSSRQAAAALRSENAYRVATLGQGQQRLGIESYRAQTAAQQGNARIQIAAERAAQAASHDHALEHMAQLNYGLSAERLILAQAKAQQVRQSGGLTANEYGTLRQKASKDLQSYYDGVAAKYQIGPDGSRVLVGGTGPGSAKTYQQSIKQLILSYPQLGPKQIIGMANKLYRPGEGGRPFKPNPKLFALLSQGPLGQVGPKGGPAGSPFGGVDNGKPSGTAGGFLPRGMSFQYDRHDQGRDIQTRPGAPIVAPGDGYVVRVASDPGGGGGHFGPSYPIVFFTSGPYKGRYVYIGHTVSAVRAGERFRSGSVLSHTQHSGPFNGGAPSGWAEIGFAPGGSPGAFNQPAPF